MINRRTFFAASFIALPVTGCADNHDISSTEEDMSGFHLSPETMEDARRMAERMLPAQRMVLERTVPYDVAPRFYPSMT